MKDPAVFKTLRHFLWQKHKKKHENAENPNNN